MTDPQNTSSQPPGDAGTPGVADPAFAVALAEALGARADELGQAWSARGNLAVGLPRDQEAARGESASGRSSDAVELVRNLVCAIRGGGWHEAVMRAGWTAGTRAFWRGVSLYQLLKELDGGVAVLLSAVDAATAAYTGPASASDGLAVARRLSDAASLLRLSAAGGYTRAMTDELRQRYRAIRHDLRNPLGTITTAVALMDDESVPEKTRQDPRMRAMVARNARSMEAMIAAALGDSAAELPAVAVQTTSLRDLAYAVRADLSAAADGIEVTVGDDLPSVPFDSAGLELLLKAVVIALARGAGERVEVAITLAHLAPRTATLAVHAPGGAPARAPDFAFAEELITRLGGRLVVASDGRVLLDVPIERRARERIVDRAVARGAAIAPRVDGSGRDARNDVAREGERADGESRSL